MVGAVEDSAAANKITYSSGIFLYRPKTEVMEKKAWLGFSCVCRVEAASVCGNVVQVLEETSLVSQL